MRSIKLGLLLLATVEAVSRSHGKPDLSGRRLEPAVKVGDTGDASRVIAACYGGMNMAQLLSAMLDLASCAQYHSSCMSMWQNEIFLQIKNGGYCEMEEITNMPAPARAGYRHQFRERLHEVSAPLAQMMMIQSDPRHVFDGKAKASFMKLVKKSYDPTKTFDQLSTPAVFASGKQPYDMKISELANRVRGGLVNMYMMVKKVEKDAQEQKSSLVESADTSDPSVQFTDPAPEYVTSTGVINPTHRFLASTPGLVMWKHDLTEIEPRALCNDGSNGVYYLDEGWRKDKYHLYLPGGYFCYDKASCTKRANTHPMLASTKGWEMEYTGSGMFDPVEGGMEGWLHGMVSYCSSDAFLGDTERLDFTMVEGTHPTGPHGNRWGKGSQEDRWGKTGTYFRGNNFVEGMLKLYIQKGLGSQKGHEFVVTGCSAGAIGLISHADTILDRLQKLAKGMGMKFYDPKITAIIDSVPITTGPAGNKKGVMTFEDQAFSLVGMIRGGGVNLPSYCKKNYPKNPLKCAYATYRLPLLETPNLVITELWDSFVPGEQIEDGWAFKEPFGPSQLTWMDKYIVEAKKVMNKKNKNKAQNWWGQACYDHCIVESPLYWQFTPASSEDGYQYSVKDMVGFTRDRNFGKSGKGMIIYDDCEGFNCGCYQQTLTHSYMFEKQVQVNIENQCVAATGLPPKNFACVMYSEEVFPINNPYTTIPRVDSADQRSR